VATPDRPENTGKKAPTNQSADQVELVRELIEALTALGNYLAAAQRAFANQQDALGEALRQSVGQFERVAECVRRLRGHLREGSDNDNWQSDI
jgi:phosphoglycerate-specific signal transduction histidine kinase